MSVRHPSQGIAFEPLTLIGNTIGALTVLATFALALRRAFYPAPPKEKQ